MQKCRDDIKKHLFENGKIKDLSDALSLERLDSLRFLPLVLYEAMRYEPPVSFSIRSYLTKNARVGKMEIRAGDSLAVNLYGLHHNSEEWIEPEKFIPERFDPSSPYALTPKGEKRDTYSYMPFIGGRRICLGKTLAEMTAKAQVSAFIHSFDFTFED